MAGKKGQYELEILIAGGTDQSLASSIKKARKEIDSLERKAGMAKQSISDSFGGMSIKGIDSLANVSDHVFGTIIDGAKIAGASIAGILGASTAVGMGFEAQMSTVQAISQASSSDMRRLTELAKEMGETTKFSAEESGKALEYMAMAGWDTDKMIGGLPGIMYLAAASGEELGIVSDIVTDAMTAFGMSADEAARFADVLAQASSSSNTNVSMMGATFQYVAPVAGAYGYTIEDVAIATGLMANAGIKGEKAGTAMRTMLTNLAKQTKQMRGYMEDLGISLTDSTGEMKPFRQQMQEMRESFSGLTEAQKAEYAAGIAGKEGMSGLLAMVTASDKDFEDLAKAIDNSTGAAEEMSKVRLDNLAGDLTLLGSAAQGAGIEIYDGFSGALRDLTQSATIWVTGFTQDFKEDLPTIQRNILQFGTDFKTGFEPVLDFGEWCLEHPDVVKGTIVGIGAALGTFKLAQGVKAGFGLLTSLSTMITAWPVAAAGAVVGSIAGISTAVKENNKRLKREDMARRFGDISLSLEELDETARMIIDNGNMGKAALAIEELGKVEGLSKSFEQAEKDINRLNWKIGMGLELSEADKQDYASAIDQMVQGAINIVEQEQYTATVSVQALFGDSEAGDELIAGFDRTYTSINEEVKELGKRLGEAYSTAMEDGIIDVNEAKVINGLQTELAKITQQVSQAEFNAKLERLGRQAGGKSLTPDTFKNLQTEVHNTLAEQRSNLDQFTDKLLADAELQYSRGEITKDARDDKHNLIWNQYTLQDMDITARGVEWSAESITGAYQDALKNATPDIRAGIDEVTQNAIELLADGYNDTIAWNADDVIKALGIDQIDKATKDGMAELWENMESDFEQLQTAAQEALAAGREVPKSVIDGLADASLIGAISGNQEAIWQLIAISIADNPEYKKAIDEAREGGAEIPKQVAIYIDNNDKVVEFAINNLADEAEEILKNRFDNMKVYGTVDFNMNVANVTTRQSSANNPSAKVVGKQPESHAKGGLITRPTLSYFAENSPEMAIPIDGSSRSYALWQEAGRLLGAYQENNYGSMYSDLVAAEGAIESNSQSSFAPVFSPTIQVQGGSGEKEQIMDGLRAGYEQFVEYMERYNREKMRVSF